MDTVKKRDTHFPIRTSLDRTPSGYTHEQMRDRADLLSGMAWQESGLFVVSIDNPKLGWADKEFLRQIAGRLGYGKERA